MAEPTTRFSEPSGGGFTIYRKKVFFMIKKKILTGVMALAVVTTSYTSAFAYVPVGEDYHIAASKIEVDNFFEKEVQNLSRDAWLEKNIQAPLIKYNPRRLWKATSTYGDGLKECYLSPHGNWSDSEEGGYNYGGGYISLTKGSLLVNNTNEYGEVEYNPYPKDYNIYARSAIASDYAHETGHWYYDDVLSVPKWGQTPEKTKKDEKAVETRADAFGIRLLENVPQFSVGGDMIAIARQAEQIGWDIEQESHPTSAERYDTTYNYIRKMSNYRIGYKSDNLPYEEHYINMAKSSTFYITDKNGEKWEVNVPAQYYPEVKNNRRSELYYSADRAKYVMGQVAWAIKNNVWDKEHISVMDGYDLFNDLPQGLDVSVIVAKKNDKEWKIIDWIIVEDKQHPLTESIYEKMDSYLTGLLHSAGVDY